MLHINNTKKYGVTALQGDRTKGKLQIFRYLTEIGADINISKAKYNNKLLFTTLLNLVVWILSSYY